MLTDIVGFSSKMGSDEEGALRMLESHNTLLTTRIGEFKGTILKFMGDAILAEFPSVVEAVKCALKIQAELKAVNLTLPSGERTHVRIGVHVGDVVVVDGDIFGDGVNIASRIQALAEPGGVCVTSTVQNQIRSIQEFRSVSLGMRKLKNIQDPVEVLQIMPTEGTGELEVLGIRARSLSSRSTAPLWGGAALVTAGLLGALVSRRVSPPPGAAPSIAAAAAPPASITSAPPPALEEPRPTPAKRETAPRPAPRAPSVADLARRADEHAEAGRLDDALRDYDAALARQPGLLQALKGRGNVRKARGDGEKAIADFNQACEQGDRYSCRMVSKLKGR